MKKFLNKKTVAAALLVLVLGASLSLVGVFGWQLLTKTTRESACLQSYSLMCVKARDCGAVDDVVRCDKLVADEGFCNRDLPSVKMINECESQLRQIACTDQLPAACLTFME